MSEENAPQKERYLREVEQKLLHRELDARLLDDGLTHIRWNEKPLCSVDRDGIVRFRPADITGPEVDRQLRTVIQTAGHIKEYMQIFERAPALKAIGLKDSYKVLADFGDAVLAGQLGKKGARFVTWEWDFDRQGVHAGHYFMEDYETAKLDFAVRASLINEQRLFSDEQLAVIRNACEFALEDDATLSYAEDILTVESENSDAEYSHEWINQRLQAIQVRKELTDEWDARGVQKGVEYAILTDEITKAWSGMNTRQYKNLKGLKKENLRDNMTTLELVLNMLAEATTTEISKQKAPEGLREDVEVAHSGGKVAGDARKSIEQQTGVPVITSKNAAQLNQVVSNLIEATSEIPDKNKPKE